MTMDLFQEPMDKKMELISKCIMSGGLPVDTDDSSVIDSPNTTDPKCASDHDTQETTIRIADSSTSNQGIIFTDPWVTKSRQSTRTSTPISIVSPTTQAFETDHVYDIYNPSPPSSPTTQTGIKSKLGSFKKHTRKLSTAGLSIFQRRRGSGNSKIDVDTHTNTQHHHIHGHNFIHPFGTPPRSQTTPTTTPPKSSIGGRIKTDRTHSCPSSTAPCYNYLEKYAEVRGTGRSVWLPKDISPCVSELEELAREQYITCLKKGHSPRDEHRSSSKGQRLKIAQDVKEAYEEQQIEARWQKYVEAKRDAGSSSLSTPILTPTYEHTFEDGQESQIPNQARTMSNPNLSTKSPLGLRERSASVSSMREIAFEDGGPNSKNGANIPFTEERSFDENLQNIPTKSMTFPISKRWISLGDVHLAHTVEVMDMNMGLRCIECRLAESLVDFKELSGGVMV